MTLEHTMTSPPFSRPLQVADIPSGGRTFSLTADESECAGVARLINLPAVAWLAAGLTVTPFGRDGATVAGEVRARLTQTCVLTSEDFDSDVVAPVEIRFAPDGVDPNADVDLAELMDPGAEEPPDLLVDGRIDLGAISVEFLALALDPYPHKPGAAFAAKDDGSTGSPFAVLQGLKKDGPTQ